MRYDHGEFMTQVDLKPQMFLHPKRDLAVMHFHDESSALNVLRKLRLEDNLHLRAEDSLPGNFTESLYFHGHEVKTANTNKGGVEVDDRKVVPRYSIGNVMGRTDHQIFCKTDPVLVDGMCGGPVCLEPVVGQVEKDVVCGMVEGIVPPNHTSELLRNAAVFVESGEIRK